MNTHNVKPILNHIKESQRAYERGDDPCSEFFKNGRPYANVIKRNEIMNDFETLGADQGQLKSLDLVVDFDKEYAKDKREFMKEWKQRIKTNNFINVLQPKD